MPIDVRSLRYFVGIVSAGSISKAAEILHIAQPSLSVQIKAIEEELGTPLLDRTPRGVTPTAAGVIFLTHAQEILRRIDIVYNDIRSSVAEPSGRVAIGLPQSMAKILTLPLVRTTLERWPKIQLQIIELSTGYIPQHLLSGDIDLGLTFQGAGAPGLSFEKLVEEDLIVIGPPGKFFRKLSPGKARRISLQACELTRFPMILPAGAHSLRVLLETFQKENGIPLNVIAEVNAIPQLIELAGAGVGCTILSYASVKEELRNGLVSAARIVNPSITRPVLLCRSTTAPLSVATSIVTELISTTVRSMVSNGSWPAVIG